MVRESAPGDTDRIGQVGRVGRPIVEREQQLTPDRVSEGTTEPGQRIDIRRDSQHGEDSTQLLELRLR